jgi:endonuclease/exonuclease/phosphatase family metal-dependent hydrolase
MSFNIRFGTADDGPNAWPLRKGMLIAHLRNIAPDLLGTQEALAGQVDELQQALPRYRMLGVGRDDGKRAGEFTAIFYNSNRFDLIDSGHFWLSPQPDVSGSVGWDAALTRMASWVRLRDRLAKGKELLLLNTHWDHVGEQARVESAKLILARLVILAKRGPVIVVGDLNCDQTSEPLRILLAGEPRLFDTYRAIYPQTSPDEATFHAFSGKQTGSRIDFVFHSADFQAIHAEIDRYSEGGRYPSDHFPLLAELTYR